MSKSSVRTYLKPCPGVDTVVVTIVNTKWGTFKFVEIEVKILVVNGRCVNPSRAKHMLMLLSSFISRQVLVSYIHVYRTWQIHVLKFQPRPNRNDCVTFLIDGRDRIPLNNWNNGEHEQTYSIFCIELVAR